MQMTPPLRFVNHYLCWHPSLKFTTKCSRRKVGHLAGHLAMTNGQPFDVYCAHFSLKLGDIDDEEGPCPKNLAQGNPGPVG